MVEIELTEHNPCDICYDCFNSCIHVYCWEGVNGNAFQGDWGGDKVYAVPGVAHEKRSPYAIWI